jgi:hypothetical protein
MSKTTIPTGGITADAINGTLIADDAINSEHYTDASIDTAHVADSQITLAKTSGVGGLSEGDQWRVTADFSSDDTDPIASNWERVDTNSDKVGTGMSQSSGVFSFPSTGIYFIEYRSNYMINGQTGYSNIALRMTTDNSSFVTIAQSNSAVANLSTDSYLSLGTSVIVDITNVSTHKIRFGVSGQASVLWRGASDRNETYATFLKLGAT